ncbi:hypothetical protein ISCGN_019934, partial [Ixodes scapularis]
MASSPKIRRSPRTNSATPVKIVQWNCRGFRSRAKRANLRLFLSTLDSLPAVVALQEPGSGATLTNYITFQQDPSSCVCVHKNYTANLVDLELQTEYSYVMVTLLPLKKQDAPLHILNIYCSPRLKNVTFAALFSRALKAAGRDSLVIVGDFNAPSTLWGYVREEKRGRKLAELASTLGLTLHTDPAYPTRVGNSVTRDTCPDLTFTKNIRHAEWANTEETLGSDHCLINITIRTKPLARPHAQARLPDWNKFRQSYINSASINEQGYHAWAQGLVTHLRSTETHIQLSEATPEVDNHLLRLWEARHSLVRRWRRQKHNRKLKIRIAELTQRTAEYAVQLADSNWVDRCNTAARQMSSRSPWRLFRALIDPTQTRAETQKHLQRAIHSFDGDTSKLACTLRDQYLCTQQDPRGPAYSYAGSENAELDQPFQLHDLKAALAKMKRGTAPGRDMITVKLLANLPDPAYATLLVFINSIWLGETPIPLEWKTALVTFIPKAGKAINTDNLRPISLTSCAGKLMETMVRDRLSGFLENQNVFADTMFGFRQHRSAQDVLLQLDREILNPVECPLNDKAVLALDLQGAFDNVTHEIILHHLSQTNCGPNTFQYIKQFLSDRQSFIRIEDEEYGPYQLGTRGTPQGAVLSPLLFNLAMMKLPAQLAKVEGVQHALYADDITIWAKHG